MLSLGQWGRSRCGAKRRGKRSRPAEFGSWGGRSGLLAELTSAPLNTCGTDDPTQPILLTRDKGWLKNGSLNMVQSERGAPKTGLKVGGVLPSKSRVITGRGKSTTHVEETQNYWNTKHKLATPLVTS